MTQEEPLYTSQPTAKSLWREYRLFPDRIELDSIPWGTVRVPLGDVKAVHVRPPLVIFDRFRGDYGLAGLKLFGQNQFDAAIVEHEKALALRPDWTDVLNALATAQSKAGRHEAAVATIQRAIELNPNDPFAFTSLSIFLQRLGKIPEAESAAAKARLLNWKEELKKNPNAPPPEGGFKVIQD